MSSYRGFSLLEGVVVVLIIGLIAAIATATFSFARSRTADSLSGTTVAAALGDALRLRSSGYDLSSALPELGRYGFSVVEGVHSPALGEISVAFSEGTTLSASRSSGDCLVAFVPEGDTAAEAGWFVVEGLSCSAESLSSLAFGAYPGGPLERPVVLR